MISCLPSPKRRTDPKSFVDKGASCVRPHDEEHPPGNGVPRSPRQGPGPTAPRPRLEPLEARLVLSSGTTPYLQTNLVSDVPGLAQVTDASLVNPWGVSFSSTSPFWVSNQGTNTATLYSVTPASTTKLGLTVNIPTTASGPRAHRPGVQ